MQFLNYLIYPVLLVIMFYGAKFSKRADYNAEWLSISQMKSLQAMTALFIVCHHTAQQTCVDYLESGNIVHGLDVFGRTGYLFNAVFFFCSGYGLYKSVKSKRNYLDGFVGKRVFPVWLPYAIVCFLFTFLRIFALHESMSPVYMYTNFLGLTTGYVYGWYILGIIIFYMLFFFAFRMRNKEKLSIFIVYMGVILWTVAGIIVDHNDWFMYGQWWYTSCMLFPLGITFAEKEAAILEGLKKRYVIIVCLSVILFVAFTLVGLYAEYHIGYYGEYENIAVSAKLLKRFLTYLPQSLSAEFFVWCLLLLSFKVRLCNKVLNVLGNYTLEIYLTHGFFLQPLALKYNWDKSSALYGRPWLLLLLTAVGTIPLAFLLKKFMGVITKKRSKHFE